MSRDTEADVAFIRALAEILKENDLGEIEVAREWGDDDELKVRLSRPGPAPVLAAAAAPVLAAPQAAPHAAPHAAQAAPSPVEAPAAAAAASPATTENAVTSPMVGTAYLSGEPGAEPFVSVGDQVAEGQTLLIIEAMKTMNQIPAPRAGKVAAILVANAEPVEFGAPLVVLE
ncbi:MAG: acetyl-CoA carboxylase biotin carboxyl carrier protein [Pseudomonadota bacterium]